MHYNQINEIIQISLHHANKITALICNYSAQIMLNILPGLLTYLNAHVHMQVYVFADNTYYAKNI